MTDAIVTDPRGLGADAHRRLARHFTDGQIAELATTVALASAFSKAAIMWGPPEDMDTLEVPTPTPDPADRYA